MSKSFGKFLLFTAVAGAAAYGAYSYLQKKEQTASPAANDEDDDFDDFSEDLDEDLNSDKERSYVSLNLDKAEAIATEAFHKAKEIIVDSMHQVKETVKSVADAQECHTSFTDLSEALKNNDNGADAAQEGCADPGATQGNEDAADPDTDTQGEHAQTADADQSDAASAVSEQGSVAETDSGQESASDLSGEQVEEFFDDDDTVRDEN